MPKCLNTSYSAILWLFMGVAIKILLKTLFITNKNVIIKLFIFKIKKKRKKVMNGDYDIRKILICNASLTCKAKCFIKENKEDEWIKICDVNPNQSELIEHEKGEFYFGCNNFSYFSSKDEKINLLDNDFAKITINTGLFKWNVNIEYTEDAEGLFIPSKIIKHSIGINDDEKTWAIPSRDKIDDFSSSRIYDFDDMLGYEIIYNNEIISKNNGVERAIVGHMLMGDIGAIVASNTVKKFNYKDNMKVRIFVKDDKMPYIDIDIASIPIKSGSLEDNIIKNNIAKIKVVLDEIIARNNKIANLKRIKDNDNNNKQYSTTEELKKYKELLDTGVITKQDFNKKKKQLLNI